MSDEGSDELRVCSLCGRLADEARRMVVGPQGCVCDRCVGDASRVLADPENPEFRRPPSLVPPPALRAGDRIAVAAPAGAFKAEELHTGVERLRSRGFDVVFDEGIFDRERYLAGSDERRGRELLLWLEDPSVRAVFCARGGYGSARTLEWIRDALPEVNLSALPRKIIVGYSDLTYLLLCLGGRGRRVLFHGPQVAVDLGREEDPESMGALLDTLAGSHFPGPFQGAPLEALVPGQAEGVLFGGCLSMLVTLPPLLCQLYGPELILFVEDIGEPAYRIDRLLTEIRGSALRERIRGVVIGHLKDVRDPPGGTLREVLMDRLGDLDVPVAMGLEAGHGRPNRTLPLGVRARLDADRGSLDILDPVVHT